MQLSKKIINTQSQTLFTHLSKICLLTAASTALRGSSKRYIPALRYTARARPILAFCPPLSVMPLSPTNVLSPLGRILIS